MQRLCISKKLNRELITLSSDNENDSLQHLRIDDNGTVYAVFSDESELDISDLFPSSILDDYKLHDILKIC